MACIFGSSGKIGSLFKRLFPYAQCPHHTDPVFTPCKMYIFCNHSREDFGTIVEFTEKMLEKIQDSPDVILINIASDAEIVPIPTRLKYGTHKLNFRHRLEKRRNRVINIFFPYVHEYNIEYLFNELSKIDYTRDFYYLSGLSSIVRPIWSNVPPKVIKSNVVWGGSQYCHKEAFNSTNIGYKDFYEAIREEVQNEYRLDFAPYDSLHVGMLMWQLSFRGPKPDGNLHTDMKRCLFGNLFRIVFCVENESDYEILIGGSKYTMSTGEMIVIPGGVSHQPLKMTDGSRKIIIVDLFTSSIPNYFMILIFYWFNTLKFLGIDV
jgi:hypothetical protein